MVSILKLMAGTDIPFPQASVIIHQPTIKEISYLEDEESFYLGCNLLNFSKENLILEERENFEGLTNIEIVLAMLNDTKAEESRKSVLGALMILELMFQNYEISLSDKQIMLKSVSENDEHYINDYNFKDFQIILCEMFTLNKEAHENETILDENSLLAQIKNKIKKGKAKVAASKKSQNKTVTDIFSRYISILSIGTGKTIQDLFSLTVWQLKYEFQRFKMLEEFNMAYSQILSGAKGIELKSWMEDIFIEDN